MHHTHNGAREALDLLDGCLDRLDQHSESIVFQAMFYLAVIQSTCESFMSEYNDVYHPVPARTRSRTPPPGRTGGGNGSGTEPSWGRRSRSAPN